MSGERQATSALPAHVSNELAAALVQTLAQRMGCRALLVKGEVASHHSLRPHRVSADIDVLAEPRAVKQLQRELERTGWRGRPETEASTVISAHSVTLIHEEWPTDIDLHWHFPGFLVDAASAFERLWEERAELDRGGVNCAIAGPLGSALIAALHSVRHDDSDPRHDRELELVTQAVSGWNDAERTSLARLAELTGAAGPLEEWFADLGQEVVVTPSAALTDWRIRRHSGDTFAGQFVAGISGAPWRAKPRLLWIAFWPRGDELRASHPEIGPGRLALLGARLSRWGRGIRHAPRAIGSLVRARREEAR